MQISVEIWALRDEVLRDDPSESCAVHLLTSDNKHAVNCGIDVSPIQINFLAENISDNSSLWRRLWITCQARKKIRFHRCSFRNMNVKQIYALFLKNPNFFFHNSLSLLNFMCIPFPEPWEVEKDLRFTFYLQRLKTMPCEDIKTSENCGKELYNMWMHFSPTCCQKCECQCSKNDLLPA